MEDVEPQKSYLTWPDYVVIAVYFIFVLAVGLIASRKSEAGVSSYFLASRNMHWIPVGASLWASCVGSGLFIGLAGVGAASGIGIAYFAINASYVLLLLGWVFMPVYMSSGVYTMPEYLRERFGGQRIRIYLSVLALLLCVCTKISADLFAGALIIQEAIGKSSPEWLYISVLILLAIAAVFTMAGGLTAVMWTDFVQTILMILGAFMLMAISFQRVGGYGQLLAKYPLALASKLAYDANNNTCNPPSDYAFNLIRPVDSDLPWPGLLFGLNFLSIWYWCTDQVMVQRALASRNIIHAKAGCILCGVLMVLPHWLVVFPGMISRVLFPDEVGCMHPEACFEECGSQGGCTNKAYIKLVLELMPSGLRGIMLAVMMAALMSSLTSIFNSSSTIFTMDIWACVRRNAWKKKTHRQIEIEQLIVGRLSVLVLVIISVIWIPVIQNSTSSQLFVYIQSITSFLAPPLSTVYILAVLWTRTNEPGAFWGLMVGLIIGLLRFVLEFSYIVPPCGSNETDPRPELIKRMVGDVHYLHFSILLCFLTLMVTISVSLLTEPIPDKCLHRLTFWTRYSDVPRLSVREWRNEEDVDQRLRMRQSKHTEKREMEEGKEQVTANVTPAVSTNQRSQEQEIESVIKYIKEDPGEKMAVDCAAVICILVVTFYCGFYA